VNINIFILLSGISQLKSIVDTSSAKNLGKSSMAGAYSTYPFEILYAHP